METNDKLLRVESKRRKMMSKALKFKQQIFVVDYKGCTAENGKQGKIVQKFDTIDEASNWLGENATDNDFERFTIDGTPEAWHEQTGECGGSSICECGNV